jgi:Putative Flp pilus-assembly TadE/G-like
MKKRIYYTKARGQSIPLIAIMLVVLFGFAALAMDVGNVYAEQREVVRATNAAALEGMAAVDAERGDGLEVYTRVIDSLQSNGIQASHLADAAQAGDMQVTISFLDAAGQQVGGMTCSRATCNATGALWTANRDKISYVKVDVEGQVDTYFARLLGQEDFPVNSVAHAQSGICASGLYPIAVEASLLNTTNYTFNEPDRLYSDDTFTRLSQKRVLLRDDLATGTFGFLRWNESYGFASESTLVAGLSGDGTADEGYTEADWPLNAGGGSAVALNETDGYPLVPGQMNPNEWIHGADSSLMATSGVQTVIADHIRNRTLVNLPIYSFVTANAPNTVYYMRDVQRFLIVGQGALATGQRYLDLAYVSDGASCAGLATPPVSQTMTLAGDVSIYPHYAQRSETGDPPIQYVVILDVSGSMIWNFDGVGSINGTPAQCQGGDNPVQCGGNSPYLGDIDERRIAIAYGALGVLADSFRDGKDQIKIITFNGNNYPFPDTEAYSNAEAMANYSRVYTGSGADGWITTASELRTKISEATYENLSGSARFRTAGATPSAIGLARARDIFTNSDAYDPSGSEYKRAAIFITDGIANVTRDGQINPNCEAQDCNEGNIDGLLVSTNPAMQVLAPIPAMNNEAEQLANLLGDEGGIYAVAIGSIGVDALTGVTSNLYDTRSAADINRALAIIQDEIQFGECNRVALRTTPLLNIQSSALPTETEYGQAWNTAGLVSPQVGVVTLTGSNGTEYTGRMTWDSSGVIRYSITNLPPDDYTMSYWMVYRGSDNPVGILRTYTLATQSSNVSAAESLRVSLRPNAQNFSQEFPITMDLDTTRYDVCATPT